MVSRIDIIGQNGNTGEHYQYICYKCNKVVNYLFEDSRCKNCTRLTIEEITGETKYED